MTPPDRNPDVRKLMLVNKYATPLAILLVGLGLSLSGPVGWMRAVSVSLLVFGVVFNMGAVPVIRRLAGTAPWIPVARMWVNISINVVLVYCLGGHWPSIWLLLALTPFAEAIYAGRTKTLLSAAGVSAVLMVLQSLRDHNTPSEWGELAGHVAFIFLVSLLINEAALLSREDA